MHEYEDRNPSASPLKDETKHGDRGLIKDLFGLLLDAEQAAEDWQSDAESLRSSAEELKKRMQPEDVRAAEQLLKAHHRADTGLLFETKPFGMVTTEKDPGAGAVIPPPQIEGYSIAEEIGRGGFGVVYRAEQLVPVVRAVAVKVLRTDLATPEMVSHFRAEASVLARMNHEGIARVIDAGLDHLNRPFVAMELIEGEPIVGYCNRKNLTVRDRVRLFERVCKGVHHAHQRAVIHRDLKPTNILVEEADGHARPRIIDFGIAKLIEDGHDTARTLDGHRLGTPRYMSPEQRSGEGGIDIRIDVFALGVLLCEVLTGEVPHSQPKQTSFASSRRSGGSGTRPSTLVSGDDAERLSLSRALRGDLDRIVLKAIDPDPEMRYQSAAAMGEDLRRYLDGMPILAKDAGIVYRGIKFIRRHMLSSALVGVAAGALLVGAIGLTVGLNRATNSRDIAQLALKESERQRQRAEFVNRFLLEDMLGAIDPDINHGREITVREVFDGASARLSGREDLDLETQYTTLRLIGLNYGQIGAHDEAMEALSRAAELAEEFHGKPCRQGIEIRLNLYDIIVSNGRSGMTQLAAQLDHDAGLVLEKSDPLYRNVRIRTSTSIDELVGLVEAFDQDPNANRFDQLVALANLGHLYMYSSQRAEEMNLRRRSYELSNQLYGPDHSVTLGSLATYASLRSYKHRDQETLDLYYRAYEPARRILGLEHPITLRNMRVYAYLLGQIGDLPTAIGLMEENVTGAAARYGESSIADTLSLMYLGRLYLSADRAPEALAVLERVRDNLARQWSAQHNYNVDIRLDLAACRLALRDGEGAREDASSALTISKPDSLRMARSLLLLAQANEQLDLTQDAIRSCGDALRVFGLLEADSARYLEFGDDLAATLDRLGMLDNAAAVRGRLVLDRAGWDG